MKKNQTSSSNLTLNMYYCNWLMSITHLWRWPLIQYLNSGMFINFCQTSHHEWETIHNQLNLHLECYGYQLKHIHPSLKIEYLHHLCFISSSDKYHKYRDHHIFPRSKYEIFGHLFSLGIFQIFNISSQIYFNRFWLIRNYFFHPPFF